VSGTLFASACVDLDGKDSIAGWNKRGAWQRLRVRFVPGQPEGWAEAVTGVA
jgi:hypothetical protein